MTEPSSTSPVSKPFVPHSTYTPFRARPLAGSRKALTDANAARLNANPNLSDVNAASKSDQAKIDQHISQIYERAIVTVSSQDVILPKGSGEPATEYSAMSESDDSVKSKKSGYGAVPQRKVVSGYGAVPQRKVVPGYGAVPQKEVISEDATARIPPLGAMPLAGSRKALTDTNAARLNASSNLSDLNAASKSDQDEIDIRITQVYERAIATVSRQYFILPKGSGEQSTEYSEIPQTDGVAAGASARIPPQVYVTHTEFGPVMTEIYSRLPDPIVKTYERLPPSLHDQIAQAGVNFSKLSKSEITNETMQSFADLIHSFDSSLRGLPEKEAKALRTQINKLRLQLRDKLKDYVRNGIDEAVNDQKNGVRSAEDKVYIKYRNALRIYFTAELGKVGNIFTRMNLIRSINKLETFSDNYRDFETYFSRTTHTFKNGVGEFYSRLSRYDNRIKESLLPEQKDKMLREEMYYYVNVIHPALQKDRKLREEFFWRLVDRNPPDMPIRPEMKAFLIQEREKFKDLFLTDLIPHLSKMDTESLVSEVLTLSRNKNLTSDQRQSLEKLTVRLVHDSIKRDIANAVRSAKSAVRADDLHALSDYINRLASVIEKLPISKKTKERFLKEVKSGANQYNFAIAPLAAQNNKAKELYKQLSDIDKQIQASNTPVQNSQILLDEMTYYQNVIHPALQNDEKLKDEFFFHIIDRTPPMPISLGMRDFLIQKRKKFK